MVEIKTTTKKHINKEHGKETFTIKREWLDKLEREAAQEGMEFKFLKFSFKEHDDKFYIVIRDTEVLSMIATMKHDREELYKLQNEINIYKKKYELIEAENTKKEAEIQYLKALLEKDNYHI